uniref:Uncharacterized protein n=1 Tax=Vespula pensylvanica TaxID=30213 RepID=A0A836XM17_VESPE|nr:hypothetical protein H0235_015118 [Vespula pensylvanica]
MILVTALPSRVQEVEEPTGRAWTCQDESGTNELDRTAAGRERRVESSRAINRPKVSPVVTQKISQGKQTQPRRRKSIRNILRAS